MDLLQENQALLQSVPPTLTDMGRSTISNPLSERTDTRTVHQHNSVSNTSQNRRGGRGRGRRGGRGGHQDTPQSRRPTLLEMVKASILERKHVYFRIRKLHVFLIKIIA